MELRVSQLKLRRGTKLEEGRTIVGLLTDILQRNGFPFCINTDTDEIEIDNWDEYDEQSADESLVEEILYPAGIDIRHVMRERQ